ncbi:MAG: 3-phosphoshikimate 1-carboxyvinyltransferase [Elusimicrobia bacterium]|nr:3-phosphoshikimate 1-carboxyvinyltransferase [Elusimicrobiota bacterium]
MRLAVSPGRPLRGTVKVPGDKSLAHRALIFAALAEGVSRIANLPDSADARSTIACLRALGVKVGSGRVRGTGGRFQPPRRALDAGNSGTTARLLLGLLAGQPFAARLTGDASLRRRPMGRVAQPLRLMGARISLRGQDRLPASVHGAALRGIRFAADVPSAQLKSAVLLAGLLARGETTVTEPLPSRDHTERLLPFFGVRVARRGRSAAVTGPARLRAVRWRLPGDASSAAFWVAAAALVPGSRLRLPRVGANPGRTGFLRVLRRMGARISCSAAKGLPEPVWDIVVESGRLSATTTSAAEAPGIIDELPLLALAASQAAGTSRFQGLAELRHKESDRLAGTLRLLRAFGGRARIAGDTLAVRGPARLRGAAFDPRGDHRLAMTAAVAGLIAQGSTTVAGAECIAISYPGFCAELGRLG